jgi:flavodoxin
MIRQISILILSLISVLLLPSGCLSEPSGNTYSNPQIDSAANSSMSTITNTSENSTVKSAKPSKNNKEKMLVVYYSLTGNTKDIANFIKNETGADIFEIKSEFDYYRKDVEEIAKKHLSEGYKPKLTSTLKNIDQYDLIFIGAPVWWFSVPPPVMSFLSQYELKGKKVVPFCTCGSDYGDFFKQFEKECSDAKLLKSISFTKNQLSKKKNVEKDIIAWLKEIGIKKLKNN